MTTSIELPYIVWVHADGEKQDNTETSRLQQDGRYYCGGIITICSNNAKVVIFTVTSNSEDRNSIRYQLVIHSLIHSFIYFALRWCKEVKWDRVTNWLLAERMKSDAGGDRTTLCYMYDLYEATLEKIKWNSKLIEFTH